MAILKTVTAIRIDAKSTENTLTTERLHISKETDKTLILEGRASLLDGAIRLQKKSAGVVQLRTNAPVCVLWDYTTKLDEVALNHRIDEMLDQLKKVLHKKNESILQQLTNLNEIEEHK